MASICFIRTFYAGYVPLLSTGYVPLSATTASGNIPAMSTTLKDQILRRIERRLDELKLSANAAGIASGLGKDLIRDWRRSKALPRLDSLAKLAPVLKTSPEWLAYEVGPDSVRDVSVPIVSWVAASRFVDVPQILDASDAPTLSVGDIGNGKHLALEVKGDSMNLVAPEGSKIVVALDQRELLPRRFYVFIKDGSATFKRYMVGPERLDPFSTNGEHEALPIDETTAVIGRVVRVINDL